MPDLTPLSPAQTAWLVNLIRRAAATEIMPRFKTLMPGEIDTKSGPNDLVTEADRAAEAMITRALQDQFPDAYVVGEETAEQDPDYRAKLSAAPLSFVIDPVDGTWNFAHGMPAFGTMVAVCRAGVPVMGLIYDPVTGEMALGTQTQAQSLPRLGTPRGLQTAAPKPLAEMIGYLEPFLLPPGTREAVAAKALQLAQVTTLRCSAYHYRLLAQGAVDFSMASKLSPWDHLPGARLVEAAGGHVAMLDGRPYDATCDTGHLLAASSKEVWTALRDHFAENLL